MDFKKNKRIGDKITFAVSLFIRVSLIFAIVLAIFNNRWAVLFVSSLTLVLTFLPALIERNYKIYLPAEFEFIIVLFIYASIFLGGVKGYYTKIWWWDVVLHTGSGVVLGFVGFLIVYVLYYERKVRTSPLFIALFSFCFAVAIGAIWEVFEFVMDTNLGLNMQKSGLIDTMWDIIVDCLGALFASVLGYFYVKKGKSFLFSRAMNKFIRENPSLFEKN